MSKMIIHGGKKLSGEITISGAKNSTVAIIPASILSETPVTLDSVPHIEDVKNLRFILEDMNVTSKFINDRLIINPMNIVYKPLFDNKVKMMRASYYFMGALLSRFGKAEVGLPGGDDIGARPIDQHIKGFLSLGAKVIRKNGVIILNAPKEGLHGAHITLDIASVGATMNLLLAAVKTKGQTIIENVAKEPEIIDLATFLNNMGAHIRGAGTNVIRINGVKHLKSNNSHTIIPDRVETGTYLSLAATVGNGINIKNVILEHLDAFLAKLEAIGVKMDSTEDSIFVYPSGYLSSINIETSPYPGFATDLQQPITPLLLKAHGQSTVTDNIYPERTSHVPQLVKMNADIRIKNNTIFVQHSNELRGTIVSADEIRGGACLMIAGLMAKGKTIITNVDNILRGYSNVVNKLNGIGADVKIIKD